MYIYVYIDIYTHSRHNTKYSRILPDHFDVLLPFLACCKLLRIHLAPSTHTLDQISNAKWMYIRLY